MPSLPCNIVGMAERAFPQDQRKVASVLFADIVGSTGLVADRDPEQALDLLRPALDLLGDAARRYGGMVNRITGDGLMALFGAPLTDEEHALGACCAALEMQSALLRAGLGLELRIGIHTGDVIVHGLRVGGIEALDAAGAAVHLAARLQQGAPPGDVWISDMTFGLAHGRLVARAVGPVPLRGFETPVAIHALTAADPSLTRLDIAGRRGLSPFVNRLREMALLRGALDQALAGRGQAVALVGDAGIGKSRLIRDFAATIGADARVIEARGLRWRDDSGFLPLRSLLRRLFGIAATEADIPARLVAAGVAAAAQAPIAALLGAEPGPDWARLEATQRRRRMIEACADALLHAAGRAPLVAVLDDLHWTDPETEAVIARLLDRMAGCRLLLVLGWRPDFAPGWQGAPALTVIPLVPLSETESRDLARSLLAPHYVETTAAEEIAARADGNPFFIEEAAAMPDLATLPPTVRSLLGARLDRLPAAEKHLMEVVAAVGEPTTEAVLAAVMEVGQPDLGAMVPHLEKGGFLRIDGVGDAVRVACRHSLFQEAAYSGLTGKRRRAMHAAIAVALERIAGDRVAEEAEVLARHARRGELWEASLRHARVAADRAMARFANREAARFYDDALVALSHLPQDAANLALGLDLRFAQREALFRLGRIEALRTRLDEAEVLAQRLGDRARLGQLRVFQSHHAFLGGDHAAAVAAAERAAEQAAQDGDAALALRAVFQRALGEMGQGRLADCVAGMARVAAEADAAAHGGRYGLDPPLVVVALGYQARALTDLGALAEASEIVAACKARAAVVARPFSWIFPALAEGHLLTARGEARAAVAVLTEALAMCDRAESDLVKVVALMLLGQAEAAAGEVTSAIGRFERSIAMGEAMGFLLHHRQKLEGLAGVLAKVGRGEEARVRMAEALAMGGRQG